MRTLQRLRHGLVLSTLVCCCIESYSQETPEGLLKNPQFFAEPVTTGWEVSVYGAQPELRREQARDGGRGSALLVKAPEPSDTALGQEVTLLPAHYYRFSGWVRTASLQPKTANVYGTLQVQNQGGRGIIASGPNHEGDTEWTRATVFFRAPADGRVRLCLFFAGFGTATGAASFAELTLEEIQPEGWPIRVTGEPAGTGSISPLQYGQFIEYLCNLVPGMWAEKLYDGSFEGLTPYKFEFIKETDFKEKPWHPSGEVNRAEYTLDRQEKISGEASKKISVAEGALCTVGLSQEGIYVGKKEPLDFNCWFKAKALKGPLRIRLHHGTRTYATAEFILEEAWKKYQCRLLSSREDDNATFTIEFTGPGTLWLDNASLMPVHTVGGWRPEVVQAVRELKPGIIRFGGSALDDSNLGQFEWRDTIGDPEHRRPFRAWGGLQPVGPGLEEIVQFCQAVKAEPLICVRINGRKPKDAADEVEYFNGAATTEMGAWRARNGHAGPYRIKYWQIGNEQSGAEYEKRLPEFCRAMKAADSSIELMSSFPTRGVLEGAGELIDFVCPHHYSHDLAWMQNDLNEIEKMIQQSVPGRAIHIGVTEWNTTAGDAGPKRAMLWSLANALACSRYHNLMHRHCASVRIANRSNLANSFCSGIIQTDNHRLFKTPTYYAQQLYANLAGTQPLRISCELPVDLGPDFSATIEPVTRTLTLFAVNDGLRDVKRPLDFSEIGGRLSDASVWTLADRKKAAEPDAFNSFDDPERVAPQKSSLHLASPRFDYVFPKLSLTVIRAKLRN